MNQIGKILIVDDEQDITEFLSYNFASKGFDVRTADNGKNAVKIAQTFQPDVIIMDIMMPKMDGIEACQEIRETEHGKKSIIILLTARGEDYSQIAGFEAGADDYLVKPISVKVLVAKVISTLTRRKTWQQNTEAMEGQDGLVIDADNYMVYQDSREILLPRKEFEILALISSTPNRLFRREEIYNHIWGSNTYVSERTIDVYIRKIRSKIGDAYIRTVKGVGYKFVNRPTHNEQQIVYN